MFKVSEGNIEQYDFKIEINSLKVVIIKSLQDENATLRERCSKLEQRPVVFESSTNDLEQYGRRNDIVISGIPDSADINHLEESVTEMLSDTDVKVTSNGIEACHRIGKKSRINRQKPRFNLLIESMLRKLFLTKIKYLKIIKTIHSTPTIILFLLARIWQERETH